MEGYDVIWNSRYKMYVQALTLLNVIQNNVGLWVYWKVRKLGVSLHIKMIYSRPERGSMCKGARFHVLMSLIPRTHIIFHKFFSDSHRIIVGHMHLLTPP